MMLCLSGSELGLRFVVLIGWLRSLFMYDSMVGFICIYNMVSSLISPFFVS